MKKTKILATVLGIFAVIFAIMSIAISASAGKLLSNSAYTITLNTDGGELEAGYETTMTEQTTIPNTLPTVTKEGYTFNAWFSDENFENEVEYGSKLTKNITLYAKLVSKTKQYTVTYHDNGADSGSVPEAEVITGGTGAVTVVNNLGNLAKNGCTFKGWSLTPNGVIIKTVTYNAKGEDVDFYAVWNDKKVNEAFDFNEVYWEYNGECGNKALPTIDTGVYPFEIIFHVNNQDANISYYSTQIGQGSALSNEVENKTAVKVTLSGEGTQIFDYCGKYTINASITDKNGAEYSNTFDVFYQGYSIAYSDSGATSGSAPTDTGVYIANNAMIKSKNTLAKEGYKFVGWSYTENSTTVDLLPSSVCSLDHTKAVNYVITLYPVWEKGYVVTFDGNGSEGGTIQETGYIFSTQGLNILQLTMTRQGYTPIGWSEDKNATTSTYGYGSYITEQRDMTLYVVWQKVYYFYIDLQDGSEPIEMTNSGTSGLYVYVTNVPKPKRDNYIFLGYNTDKNATTGEKPNFFYFTFDGEDVTYYAIWQQVFTEQPSKDNDYTASISSDLTGTITYKWGYEGFKDLDQMAGASYGSVANENNHKVYTTVDDVLWGMYAGWSITVNNLTPGDIITFTLDYTGSNVDMLQVDGATKTIVGNNYTCVVNAYSTSVKVYSIGMFGMSDFKLVDVKKVARVDVDGGTGLKFPTDATLKGEDYFLAVYQDGTEITKSHTVTPKKVSFVGEDGTEGTAPASIYQLEGRTIEVPANTFTKTGEEFSGWSGNMKLLSVGDDYTVQNSNNELVALFGCLPTHNIRYFIGTNEKTIMGAPTIYQEGVGADLTGVTPSNSDIPTGKKFVGWTLDDGTLVTNISSIQDENYDLYAKFVYETVGILTFKAEGYYVENQTNKFVVAFGAQYTSAYTVSSIGFYIYNTNQIADNTKKANLSTANLSDFAGNGYRYMTYVEDAGSGTYYAKAYVEIDGDYYFTDLISATANSTTLLELD